MTSLLVVTALLGCVTDDFDDMAASLAVPSPGQAARMALDQYDADDRRRGVTMLANAPFGGTAIYVDMYRDYVEHERDPLVRAAAIKALGRFGEPDDAVLIAPWLSRSATDSTQVRREAAHALQRLHHRQVAPALLRVLGDEGEDGQVRASSAVALGQYPQPRVLSGLMAALQANELAVNRSAAQSLHQLTGQVFGIDRYEWVDWYDATVAARRDPFAARMDYQYPTYQRADRWWDRLAFWERRPRERPDSPAGLREEQRRRTYEDEDASTP